MVAAIREREILGVMVRGSRETHFFDKDFSEAGTACNPIRGGERTRRNWRGRIVKNNTKREIEQKGGIL